MVRPKGTKNIKKHVFKDPQVQDVVEEWIEYVCPKRGLVRQKVKVKKLKKITDNGLRTFVGASSVIDDLEQEENERLLSADPEPEE